MPLQYAIANVARCANTRSDYYPPSGRVSIGGTLRSGLVDKKGLRIVQSNDGNQNTCAFECFDFTPLRGQEVLVTLGTTANRLFGGHILNISQTAPHKNQRVRFRVSCVDYSWLLGMKRITGRRWVNVSMSNIIEELIADFAPSGFTTTKVEVGLDQTDFTANHAETLLQALRRGMKQASVGNGTTKGGFFYIDEYKVVHAYVTPESDGNPLVLNYVDFPVLKIAYEADISQTRTRTYVLGGITQTTSPVPVGSSLVPVADTALFHATSPAQALAFGNQMNYFGTSPTSGAGYLTSVTAVSYAIPQGENVRVMAARVNSSAAQSLAVIIGTSDGLIDHVIDDARLSDQGARDKGDSDLALFAMPETALHFDTRTKFLRAGKTMAASITAPATFTSSLIVQRVTIADIDLGGGASLFPKRSVDAFAGGSAASRDTFRILETADRYISQGSGAS